MSVRAAAGRGAIAPPAPPAPFGPWGWGIIVARQSRKREIFISILYPPRTQKLSSRRSESFAASMLEGNDDFHVSIHADMYWLASQSVLTCCSTHVTAAKHVHVHPLRYTCSKGGARSNPTLGSCVLPHVNKLPAYEVQLPFTTQRLRAEALYLSPTGLRTCRLCTGKLRQRVR